MSDRAELLRGLSRSGFAEWFACLMEKSSPSRDDDCLHGLIPPEITSVGGSQGVASGASSCCSEGSRR
jgi:hypothetical protein